MKREILKLIEAKLASDAAFFNLLQTLITEERPARTGTRKSKKTTQKEEEDNDDDTDEITDAELQILQRIKNNLQ